MLCRGALRTIVERAEKGKTVTFNRKKVESPGGRRRLAEIRASRQLKLVKKFLAWGRSCVWVLRCLVIAAADALKVAGLGQLLVIEIRKGSLR